MANRTNQNALSTQADLYTTLKIPTTAELSEFINKHGSEEQKKLLVELGKHDFCIHIISPLIQFRKKPRQFYSQLPTVSTKMSS